MTAPLDPRRFAGVPPVTDEELVAWAWEAARETVGVLFLPGWQDAPSCRIVRLVGQLVRERASGGERRAGL